VLVRDWITNVGEVAFTVGSEGGEVLARTGEAEVPVGATSDHVGVSVILAVVFPEADSADVVCTSLVQREETTARTRVWLAALRQTDTVVA
jgi:hypothetical protein